MSQNARRFILRQSDRARVAWQATKLPATWSPGMRGASLGVSGFERECARCYTLTIGLFEVLFSLFVDCWSGS